MHQTSLLILTLIVVAGISCHWLAWRLKLPSIIFLLSCGILAGPVLELLKPDQLLGDLFFPLVSLFVAVILFEGSLSLRFSDIPGLEKVIRNLITFGVAISWGITTVATRLLLDFSWGLSFLFGAIMVVTGPTVIMPMIRTVRPKENIANVLQWEGILIDPIGAVLAVLTYEIIVSGGVQHAGEAGGLVFAKILLIGCILGAGAGQLLGTLIRKHWVPHYLQNIITLALVCGVFTLSDLMEPESGLLTVTVMGLWLANLKGLVLEELLDFKESLSLLLLSVLFILLAARMDLQSLYDLGWPALGILLVIQFLVRPLSVQLCALGSKLSMPERHLLAWIAPRGIVAAAVSALFALKLENLGYQHASQLVPLTFMVIIGTVLLQSTTAGSIARWLKVADPEPKGFLIIGANRVARGIAKALEEVGIKTTLADPNWNAVKEAKLQGLNTYWGNPVSEHAERNISLAGLGHLLAITDNTELNALVAYHYRHEFEPTCIYSIRNHRPEDDAVAKKSEFKLGGNDLFDEDITFAVLDRKISQGAEIKTTPLTSEFSFDDYLEKLQKSRCLLFALNNHGLLYPFHHEADFKPKEGWKILALEKTPSMDER